MIAFRVIVDRWTSPRPATPRSASFMPSWRPVPSRFKDYLALPKPNGLPVAPHDGHRPPRRADGGPDPHRVEMHRNAELGIAAHWKYKAGDASRSPTPTTRSSPGCGSCSSGTRSSRDPHEFLDIVKVDLFPDVKSSCSRRRGDVINLPRARRRWTSPTRSTARSAPSAPVPR